MMMYYPEDQKHCNVKSEWNEDAWRLRASLGDVLERLVTWPDNMSQHEETIPGETDSNMDNIVKK